MRILTIDTALQGCAVGLYDRADGMIAENILEMERGQAEHLIPMVEEITNGEYEKIDLIAVSQGPGAFAGLRIGLMCAKTLSMVLDVPAIGIPTIQAMKKASQENADIVLIETKRADYYAQIGKNESACLTTEQIEQETQGKSYTIVGNANERFKKEARNTANLTFETINIIAPKILAVLALEKFEDTSEDINTNPIYLRLPEIGTPKRTPRKIKGEK